MAICIQDFHTYDGSNQHGSMGSIEHNSTGEDGERASKVGGSTERQEDGRVPGREWISLCSKCAKNYKNANNLIVSYCCG